MSQLIRLRVRISGIFDLLHEFNLSERLISNITRFSGYLKEGGKKGKKAKGKKAKRYVIGFDVKAFEAAYTCMTNFNLTGLVPANDDPLYDRRSRWAYSSIMVDIQPYLDFLINHGYLFRKDPNFAWEIRNAAFNFNTYGSTIWTSSDRMVRYASLDYAEGLRAGLVRFYIIDFINSLRPDMEDAAAVEIVNQIAVSWGAFLNNLSFFFCPYTVIIESVMNRIGLLYRNMTVNYSVLGIYVLIRRLDLIEEIIRNGAEVNPSAVNVVHPFLIAVHMGYDDVCRLLLSHGAVVNLLWKDDHGVLQNPIFIHPNILQSKNCVFYILRKRHDWPFWDAVNANQHRRMGWAHLRNVAVGRCYRYVNPGNAPNVEGAPVVENAPNFADVSRLKYTIAFDSIEIRMYDNLQFTVHSMAACDLKYSCRVSILQSILKSNGWRLSLDSIDTLQIPNGLKRRLQFTECCDVCDHDEPLD
ncbi:hypothetical protein CHUAL_008465 [Chamberlinius hualienensis]